MKSNLYFLWLNAAIRRALVIKTIIKKTHLSDPEGDLLFAKRTLDFVDMLHEEGLHKIAHYLDVLACELHDKAHEQLINNGA
ncbi:hypothetical protein PCIT_a3055 [Pseudoalteromonas citrea]|uniref:Uncharacterized protein n=2 Tax=Pseudoalteromonas citrea TaxID=43655 RepID=A0AAD4AI16_9GAMM|nr:hypothetical protein [Pseudoalteromonas citrea]KAF7770098.1 hypothetical protein PCIT_a3055 [Pseudoalteromonas citrea]